MNTKKCSKCQIEKLHTEFSRKQSAPDGLRSYCKACANAREKAYREANKEQISIREKAYREANKERIATRHKAYHKANRDQIIARKRERRKSRSDNP